MNLGPPAVVKCGAVIPGMGSSRDRTQGYVKVLRHPRNDEMVT